MIKHGKYPQNMMNMVLIELKINGKMKKI